MKASSFFALLLALTGSFALIGGIYSWGSGPLWREPRTLLLILPIADIAVATPLSFLAAYALWKDRPWTPMAVMAAIGCYLYGSAAVVALLWLEGSPYPPELIVPPAFGFALSLALALWLWKNRTLYRD